MAAQVLRVAATSRPPYLFVDPARKGNARFYGLLVDLLPTLLSYGFGGGDNTTLQYYEISGSGGVLQPNGTWTGMMGELVSERADIAAFPLTLTLDRSQAVDLSYSFMNGGLGILVSAEKEGTDALAFLKPFAWQLWLAIAASMLGIAFVCWLLSHLSPMGRYEIKRLRRLDVEHHEVCEYVVESANDSSIMEAASTQLGQMPQPRSRSWAVRIVALAYGVFCIIILSSYTANLAAFLTVKQLVSTVDSTISLLRNGGNFAVSSGGSTVTYFQNALDPVAAALASRMRIYSGTADAVAAVRAGSVVAYITDYSTLKYFASVDIFTGYSLPCDVTISGQAFGPGSLTFGLQKNSSLLAELNQALLKVQSNGVLDQLVRKWTTDIDQCRGDQTDTNRLNVQSLTGLFYMLLLAVGIGLCIAAIERIVSACPAIGHRWNRLWRSGHSLATACLPEQHRPVVPQPTGFSKSALEISRSFAPPRMSVQTSGSNRSSVRFGLASKKSTAQAAADAVAAADAAAEAEELELAVKAGEYSPGGSFATNGEDEGSAARPNYRRTTSAISGGGTARVICAASRGGV